MSDALDYLIRARPDAMKHYFRFLKESGKYLDPKTRDLISVITKVHAQTEKGFRQYLLRALRDGCTPMEIIDALLMAFPALGLAKIVWAMDVLVAMNLPEFQAENLGAEPRWHRLGAVPEFEEGKVARVDSDGRSVFVHRANGGFSAYDSRCPHQTTDIPLLALAGDKLTCPKHGWEFNIMTGECIHKGNRPLRRFETNVEDGALFARW